MPRPHRPGVRGRRQGGRVWCRNRYPGARCTPRHGHPSVDPAGSAWVWDRYRLLRNPGDPGDRRPGHAVARPRAHRRLLRARRQYVPPRRRASRRRTLSAAAATDGQWRRFIAPRPRNPLWKCARGRIICNVVGHTALGVAEERAEKDPGAVVGAGAPMSCVSARGPHRGAFYPGTGRPALGRREAFDQVIATG